MPGWSHAYSQTQPTRRGAFHGGDSDRAVAIVQRPRQRWSWLYDGLDGAPPGLGSASISHRDSKSNGFPGHTDRSGAGFRLDVRGLGLISSPYRETCGGWAPKAEGASMSAPFVSPSFNSRT